jgi:hypothetical protein
MFATIHEKDFALKALAARRQNNLQKKRIDNASLPAGAPMYFDCLTCAADIVVPEDYMTKPKLCPECQALKEVGWLE